MKGIKVLAPATLSNLGCGFDVFGMAIQKPYDEIRVQLNSQNKIIINSIKGDQGKISTDPSRNTASIAIASILKKIKSHQGITIDILKKMPLASGLGSSAASAVGAAYALNCLLELNFNKKELIAFALDGEMFVSGGRHADNVAPSMLGGMIICKSYPDIEYIQLHPPIQLYIGVIYLDIEVLTKKARKILSPTIKIQDAIAQWANTATFINALYTQDFTLLRRAVFDIYAEPKRAKFIPYYDTLKELMYHNAYGCGISGSGPSYFGFFDCLETASRTLSQLQKFYTLKNINTKTFISKINNEGAKVL